MKELRRVGVPKRMGRLSNKERLQAPLVPTFLGTFAVGTLITERPPHNTVRAAFPHTASTLGE
ncbi:hypothetical protein ACVJGD_000230 [Bradyrhizobium sp. USDA 10063]